MKIIPFFARGWESNSYLILSGNQAALIDAGVSAKTLLDTLKAEGAELKYILLTHGHFDHTLTADALREQTGAKLLVHQSDAEMLGDATKSALAIFMGRDDTIKDADGLLKDKDTVTVGDVVLKAIHTPGHSMGSLCYLADGALFTGDTLFDGGFGRFDLYGGDFDTLKGSLNGLAELDGSLEIYPGHGGTTVLDKALKRINYMI